MWRQRICAHARAARDRCLDIRLLAGGEHDRAHEAGDARHLGDDDGDDDDRHASLEQRDEGDGEQDRRNRHQPVHQPHDDQLDRPEEAGEQTNHEPDRDRNSATLRPTARETRAP